MRDLRIVREAACGYVTVNVRPHEISCYERQQEAVGAQRAQRLWSFLKPRKVMAGLIPRETVRSDMITLADVSFLSPSLKILQDFVINEF